MKHLLLFILLGEVVGRIEVKANEYKALLKATLDELVASAKDLGVKEFNEVRLLKKDKSGKIAEKNEVEIKGNIVVAPQFVLQKYQCVKQVHAIKVDQVKSNLLCTAKGNIVVSKEYLEKHKPKAGGYYVMYKDGYESYSPKNAFEEGYVINKNIKIKQQLR